MFFSKNARKLINDENLFQCRKEIESMKVCSNVSIYVGGYVSVMIFDVLGAIPILISCIGIIVSFCHR